MDEDYPRLLEIRKPPPPSTFSLARLFWPAVLVATLIFLGYLFIQPAARLTPEPPAEFFESRPEWSASRKAIERRLAQVYWQKAQTVIQWRYPYGSTLPVQPIPEFNVDPQMHVGTVSVPADARERYWRRLRSVWGLPNVWKTSYEWNDEWAYRFLRLIYR